MSEQLAFDFDAVRATLADRLRRDNRDVPLGGAERLLTALVKLGLDEDALVPAAMLAAELDRPPADNGGAVA